MEGMSEELFKAMGEYKQYKEWLQRGLLKKGIKPEIIANKTVKQLQAIEDALEG